MNRFRYLLLIGVTTFLTAMACATVTNFQLPGGATPTPPPAPTASSADGQLEVLDAVEQAIRDGYIREDYDGVDWDAAVAEIRTQVTAGLSDTDFAEALRSLMDRFPAGKASYTSREERIERESADANTSQGIGVFYGFRDSPEPRVIVLAVIPDSPAEQAGLKAHDTIYAVDGEPIKAEERDTVVNRIRGAAGSSITLTVQTPGEERRDVTLERGSITSSDTLRGGVSEDGIAYYRLPVVANGETVQLVAQDLEEKAATIELKAVILDLRLVGNGDDNMLLALLTIFGNGAYGELYTRAETQSLEVEGVDVAGSQDLPLYILVGPDTRGTAEILAAAMQATERATVIGLNTPGIIEGFTRLPLPDGSEIQFAASSYRLPDGADFAGAGLTPQVAVEGDWDSFAESADDPVLNTALELIDNQ
ncbi:MAG: S41 family peptidase [Anaerolineales bacterium]